MPIQMDEYRVCESERTGTSARAVPARSPSHTICIPHMHWNQQFLRARCCNCSPKLSALPWVPKFSGSVFCACAQRPGLRGVKATGAPSTASAAAPVLLALIEVAKYNIFQCVQNLGAPRYTGTLQGDWARHARPASNDRRGLAPSCLGA